MLRLVLSLGPRLVSIHGLQIPFMYEPGSEVTSDIQNWGLGGKEVAHNKIEIQKETKTAGTIGCQDIGLWKNL